MDERVRELQRAGVRRYKARMYALLEAAKDVPCQDCGLRYPTCVMDFDHRPGEEKLFVIASGGRSRGQQNLLAEIAKCDVVCSNCHRIRTHITRKQDN